MEMLPPDVPAQVGASPATLAARPRPGSATSRLSVRPAPVQRASATAAAGAGACGSAGCGRTMPLGEAGGVPLLRRSGSITNEAVYKPIGLSLFAANAAARRAAAESAFATPSTTTTPRADSGPGEEEEPMDEAAQDALRRELRAQVDQLRVRRTPSRCPQPRGRLAGTHASRGRREAEPEDGRRGLGGPARVACGLAKLPAEVTGA
jgi:hypothetical protein